MILYDPMPSPAVDQHMIIIITIFLSHSGITSLNVNCVRLFTIAQAQTGPKVSVCYMEWRSVHC